MSMDEKDLKKKTGETANLLFDGYPWDRPYPLWRSFDKEAAKDLSLYVTGVMYARQKLDHPTRQLVAISSLAALGHLDELRLHIWGGLNVGLSARDVAEAIFQVGTYAGIPVTNQALGVLQEVLEKRGEWPPSED